MVTTLAPCLYCSGLVVQFKIGTVVVGESRTFGGGLEWLRERKVNVVEVDSVECESLLSEFIRRCPQLWHEDIGE
jgi:cytosine deaminase